MLTSLVVLATVAVGALLGARAALFSPEDGARAYVEALQQRDADVALATLLEGEFFAEEPLLQESAMEHEGYLPPKDVNLLEITGGGADDGDGAAMVVVTFRVGEQDVEREAVLTLRQEGSVWQPLRRWLVVDGLYDLNASWSYGDRVQVAGQDIPLEGGDLHATAVLGAYQVSTPQDDPFYEPTSALAVSSDAAAAPELEPAIRTSVTEAVNGQIRATLSACTAQETLAPEGCPFSSDGYYGSDVTDIQWTVLQDAQWGYALSSEGDLLVQTTEYGYAVATGTTTDYFGSPDTYEDEVAFGVDGRVVATGDRVDYQMDLSEGDY